MHMFFAIQIQNWRSSDIARIGMFAAFDEKDCHRGVWACQRKQGPQQRVESVEHEGMRNLKDCISKLDRCICIGRSTSMVSENDIHKSSYILVQWSCCPHGCNSRKLGPPSERMILPHCCSAQCGTSVPSVPSVLSQGRIMASCSSCSSCCSPDHVHHILLS